MKPSELYKKMSEIPLFKGFNIDEIEEIFQNVNFQIKKYRRNESIFFRGDKIEHIIIILEGSCRSEMQKVTGDTIIIDYIRPYQILASAFIFGNSTVFPVDLTAMENSRILFLNKADFIEIMKRKNQLSLNFLDDISNKAQFLSKRIWFNFVNKKINEKVLSYINENQKDGYISFRPNISELSKRFEVTRPSLSREISTLCEKEILFKEGSNRYRINFQKLGKH